MNKKEKILKTALGLIVNQGIQETPMSQISKVAGVAVGTIYHHFKGKNEILNGIYISLKEAMGNALKKNTQNLTSYKSLFFEFWNNLFDFYSENPTAFKFLQTFAHSPLITSESQEEGAVFYNPIILFFEEGMNKSIIKSVDIDLLAETIHGNIVSLVHFQFQNPEKINNNIISQAINMSWDSINISNK